MITNKDRKFIGLALNESARSTYNRVKIGSVIVRAGKVVSRGANLNTSHPLQRKFNDLSHRCAPTHSLHSELHAIVKAKTMLLHGCSIYIARINKAGVLANCKPCVACSLAIKAVGIVKVTYTTLEGISCYESY